jgi:hypothetical protein
LGSDLAPEIEPISELEYLERCLGVVEALEDVEKYCETRFAVGELAITIEFVPPSVSS